MSGAGAAGASSRSVDTVGQKLQAVVSCLEKDKIGYRVVYTRPVRDFFAVDEKELFVVRQKMDAEGRLVLTAAAKMRKEV